MQSSARESYLATEVMTATPQKLQLMLIDTAIRSAKRARQLWRDEEDEGACEALIHAQEVIGEMLASLNAEVAPDLVKKVASIYMFIFRSLMEANYQQSEEKLNDALRVLEVERETWRQLCDELGSKKEPDQQDAVSVPTQQASPSPAPPQTSAPLDLSADSGTVDSSSSTGFSLEA